MRYVSHGRLCTKRKVQIMKAAIYCRLSKEDEYKIGESESIQNQKSMLIQYAIEKGFDIYQIYSMRIIPASTEPSGFQFDDTSRKRT